MHFFYLSVKHMIKPVILDFAGIKTIESNGRRSRSELVIAALLPSKAGAIFTIRMWAGIVGGDNAAARLNPKVAARDERNQDEAAAQGFRPATRRQAVTAGLP